MSLNEQQTKELLKPIDPKRVGRDGKGFSHVEAWDIRRTMNQIFGFGNWSADVQGMELVAEREVSGKDGKSRWNVIYRAQCTLRIGEMFGDAASYTEWAAGDATNPTLADAHDQAIKTAESQAFKRCAVNLGDQFGLSLYKNGSTEATVKEIVGQEHTDSHLVDDLVEAFEECLTEDDLSTVAQQIPSLDLSEDEKGQLRSAYTEAKQRIEASVEPIKAF
jgi:recombination DNA repair RAD52 pathway protein